MFPIVAEDTRSSEDETPAFPYLTVYARNGPIYKKRMGSVVLKNVERVDRQCRKGLSVLAKAIFKREIHKKMGIAKKGGKVDNGGANWCFFSTSVAFCQRFEPRFFVKPSTSTFIFSETSRQQCPPCSFARYIARSASAINTSGSVASKGYNAIPTLAVIGIS